MSNTKPWQSLLFDIDFELLEVKVPLMYSRYDGFPGTQAKTLSILLPVCKNIFSIKHQLSFLIVTCTNLKFKSKRHDGFHSLYILIPSKSEKCLILRGIDFAT